MDVGPIAVEPGFSGTPIDNFMGGNIPTGYIDVGPSSSEAAGFNPAGGGSMGKAIKAFTDKVGRHPLTSTAMPLLAQWAIPGLITLSTIPAIMRGHLNLVLEGLQITTKGLFKFRNLTKTSLTEQILECSL